MKAIVLRRQVYAESDLILEFALENERRVSAIAKGALASKRRFPHKFYWAGIYDLEVQEREGGLSFIKSCEMRDYFPSPDLEPLTRWSVVLEWIQRSHDSPVAFQALQELMRSLLGERRVEKYHRFWIDEIQRHGLAPVLDRCAVCGKPWAAQESDFVFSVQDHGMTHARCRPGVRLSRSLIEYLKDPEGFGSLEDWSVLDWVTVPYLMEQMGLDLQAYQYLCRLLKPAPNQTASTDPQTASFA